MKIKKVTQGKEAGFSCDCYISDRLLIAISKANNLDLEAIDWSIYDLFPLLMNALAKGGKISKKRIEYVYLIDAKKNGIALRGSDFQIVGSLFRKRNRKLAIVIYLPSENFDKAIEANWTNLVDQDRLITLMSQSAIASRLTDAEKKEKTFAPISSKVATGEMTLSSTLFDLSALGEMQDFIYQCVSRFCAADWGDMDIEDKQQQDKNIENPYNGMMVMGAYEIPAQIKQDLEKMLLVQDANIRVEKQIWVINHWNRYTVVLFPSER